MGSACLAALVLGLSTLWLLASPASADGGQLSIAGIRTTSYPKVYLRLAISDTNCAPVGGLDPADFTVRENGLAVRSFDVQPVRQSQTPLSVVLVVDTSGSMKDQSKIDKAREAANAFISELRAIDQIEVIGFGSTVTTVVPFTNDRKALSAGLQKLAPVGDTAFYDAVYTALTDASKLPGNRVVMVLTDGEDTASKASLDQNVSLARQLGIPIYTIGLGQQVKDSVLSALADNTSGHYSKAPTADDLVYTFRLLSRQIQNEYELVYVSSLSQLAGTGVDVSISVRLDNQEMVRKFTYPMPEAVHSAPSGGLVDTGHLRAVPQPVPSPAEWVARMAPYWFQVVALTAALGVLLVFVGASQLGTRSLRETRLLTYVGGPEKVGRHRFSEVRFKPTQWLSKLAYRMFHRLLPKTWLEDTRTLLTLAGVPQGQGAEELLGLRMLMAFGLALVGYFLFSSSDIAGLVLAMVIAIGAIGYLMPAVLLRQRIKSRQMAILRSMPNALDLLAVSVEAGLGFDQALMEVCSKWQNPLTQEFTIMLNELRLGRSRKEALQGLMSRTRVPEVGLFASALIQADELGASIKGTLASQAEQIRIRRKQRAQELAHQAGVKMTFPLVLLMMPALFVVVIGPAVPRILDALGSR